MVFYANFRAFSRLFVGKGRQEGVPGAGQGANRGLPEAGVGQNTEGQAWAPNFAGWLADVFFLKSADKSTSVSSSQLLYIRLSRRSLRDGFIYSFFTKSRGDVFYNPFTLFLYIFLQL